MARVTTRLVKMKEACAALAISHDTFSRHWQAVFTETREPEEHKRGVHRRVFEDELAEAVGAGGGVCGRAAVLTYRRLVGRLEPPKPTRAARLPAQHSRPEPQAPLAQEYADLLVRLEAVEAKLERLVAAADAAS